MARNPWVYIDPHPWRHLLAWVLRRRVRSEDVVPRSSYENEVDETNSWREEYYELRGYLEQIAREHHPVVRDAEKYTGQIGAYVLELGCATCPEGWPCTSWSIATRNDLEPLRIVLEQRRPKGEPI